jgi:hypothetical protein
MKRHCLLFADDNRWFFFTSNDPVCSSGLRVKDVNDLHINFQTQQTQVFNILGFFRHRQEIESIVAAKDRSWLVKTNDFGLFSQ